jgi:hypothetical protein
MRMLDAATLGLFGFAGLMAGGGALAQDLVRQCGDVLIDYSKATLAVAGRDYQVTVENYDAEKVDFDLRIAPADGMSAQTARFQAALQSDVICMQLDRLPVEVGAGRLDEGAWLFSSGCTGHEVRMEDKC